MTFLELQTRVAELAGLDINDSASADRIKEWINQTYQEVSAFYDWPWLVKRGIIQTQTDITTGTVSVTNDSTSITFSSAPSQSVASQYMIQIGDDEDWYNISSHTAASTAATLDVAYLGSTDAAATYKLRKVVYSLPSDLDRIQFMRQTEDDRLLSELLPRDFYMSFPDPRTTDSPTFYYFHGLDSSRNWQIGLYPIPDSKINVLFWYYQKITELSADTDQPLIPEKFHNILVFGALAMYGYTFIDDTRVNEVKQRAASILEQMRRQANPGKDSHTVIKPWDQRIVRRLIGPRLPSNFGNMFHTP